MNGGPHMVTFDKHDYNFQGTCVYQLAGVCSKDSSLQNFKVLVQNDAHGKRVGSGPRLVEVNAYEDSIVVTRRHKGSILVRHMCKTESHAPSVAPYNLILEKNIMSVTRECKLKYVTSLAPYFF